MYRLEAIRDSSARGEGEGEREREREGGKQKKEEKRSESINGDNRMERAADRETGTYLPTRPGWVQDSGIII